jgi:hypothetical protein
MGRACSTKGGEASAYRILIWGNLKERDHREDLALDGAIILKHVVMKWV